MLDDWGGVINSGPVTHGPIRLRRSLQRSRKKHAKVPVKVSVGAGPANLAWHVYFKHYKNAKELSFALAPIFNAEMKDLVAAGAKYLQFEDLGAWLPLFTNDKNDYKWIRDVVEPVLRRRRREDRLALLLRERLGQRHPERQLPRGLPDGSAAFLRHPGHRRVRARLREPRHGRHRVPEEPAEGQGRAGRRARHPHQRDRDAGEDRRPHPEGHRSTCRPSGCTLSTDCGMKPLARMVAKMKLKALAEGAAIVRKELK